MSCAEILTSSAWLHNEQKKQNKTKHIKQVVAKTLEFNGSRILSCWMLSAQGEKWWEQQITSYLQGCTSEVYCCCRTPCATSWFLQIILLCLGTLLCLLLVQTGTSIFINLLSSSSGRFVLWFLLFCAFWAFQHL